MYAERKTVVRALRSRGDHDRALQAECTLPKWVDLEADAGQLHQLDIDAEAIQPTDG